MSYRFCLGASGAGKSTWLQEEVVRRAYDALDGRLSRADGPASAEPDSFLFLVPDQYTMQTQKELVLTAQRLLGRGGILNVDVLSFGRLRHRIFGEIGADDRGVLDDMGKSLILRRLSLRCRKDLKVLGERMGRPGMTAEVKSVISEFMQYGITPDGAGELSDYAAAHGQGRLAAKLRDLQVLYQAFMDERAERFLTLEEQLDLLAQAIPQSDLVRRSVVVFDGFTGFTPVQMRVIETLLQCAPEVILSLDWAEDGGTPIGDVAAGAPWEQQDLFGLTRQCVSQVCRAAQRVGAVHGEDIVIGENTTSSALSGREGKRAAAGGAPRGAVRPAAGQGAREEGGRNVPPRFAGNPAMAHLERSLFRYPVQAFGAGGAAAGTAQEDRHLPSDSGAGPSGTGEDPADRTPLPIHLVQASNPGQEVRQMCIRIRRLIEENGWAYRDFAIVAGDLAAYEDEIRVYAQRYDIPVYIDSRRAVTQNPLTEAIRAALEIGAGDYRCETVFRFLRSGLSGLSAEEIDRLENYCLAKGIVSRRRWESAFDAEYESMRGAFLRAIRPLQGLGHANAQERTRALYDFLAGIHAGEQMAALASDLRGRGEDAAAMEYDQIYGAVVHLLEELYDLPGEETISARDYQELVETGFGEIRLGTLPQQVDRIPVGDLERTRLSEVKVLFVLGVNDGAIPRGAAGGGLLSDPDREFLQESKVLRDAGLSLSPTPREQMMNQRLYLYMNLTKPSEQLWLSYSATAGDGSSLRPSYLAGLLRQLFPQLKTERPEEAPAAEQLTALKDAAGFLSAALRDYADGLYLRDRERTDEVLTLYGYCVQCQEGNAVPGTEGKGAGARPAAGRRAGMDPGNTARSGAVRDGTPGLVQNRFRALRGAAFSRYRPVPIRRQTANALYGRVIRGSVTRLETAAQCYLRQFLQYGLRLREREIYTFEANDSGTILHESVRRFGQLLREEGLSWTDYTQEQGHALIGRALRETAAQYNDQVLYATARGTYQAERLRRILERTADTLQFQLAQGDFVPAALEQEFGEHGGLRSALSGGGELDLRGRIDRVDLSREGGGTSEECIYVKILDYKSGNRDLDPVQMREGLQLQLMLYMTAERDLLQKSRPNARIVPAALLYYHFDDPMLSEQDSRKVLEEKDPDDLIRRQLRPKGLVTGGPDAFRHLDHALEKGGTDSLAVPVKTKKDGTPDSRSHVISPEAFEELSRQVQETVCRLAQDILAGRADASPVRMDKDRTACTWCPYRSACGFDLRIPGYEYRKTGE